MDNDVKLKIEEGIIDMLKTVYDPEIPVNVYDLGLIYKIDLADDGELVIDMTLTAPNCPAADFIMEDVRQKVESVEGVTSAQVNLVFEPEWEEKLDSTIVGLSQEKISEIMFEKSKEYATHIYQENEALIHSGKVNYMFLEIDKVTRAYVQPIGK